MSASAEEASSVGAAAAAPSSARCALFRGDVVDSPAEAALLAVPTASATASFLATGSSTREITAIGA